MNPNFWDQYTVTLHESAGWLVRNQAGRPATYDDMTRVLGNLSAVETAASGASRMGLQRRFGIEVAA